MGKPEPAGAARDVAAPESLSAWGVLAALSLIGFALIGATMTSVTIFTTTMQAEFGWTELELGAGPMALLVGMSAGNLLAAPLFNRLGARGPFLVGGLVTAIGWAASGVVSSLGPFVACMALSGVGIGAGSIVPAITILTRVFIQRRGFAIAVFIGTCAVGSFSLPMAVNWLIAHSSWRAAFGGVGALIALIALPMAMLVRAPGAPASQEGGAAPESGLSSAQVLRLPSYWILVAVLTLSQICMNAVLFSVVAYFKRVGIHTDFAVAIFGVANFAALPGLLWAGVLADRFGVRVVLFGALLMQTLGTFSLLGVAAPSEVISRLGLAGFVVFWGGAGGLPTQIGSMFLADLIGRKAFASMLGIIFTLGGLLGAMAPIAMGALFEVAHGYFAPFALCGVLCCLTVLGTLFITRRTFIKVSTQNREDD